MRIGIDARFFGVHNKGLGRYTEKLLKELEKIDKSNQYFIFLRNENFSNYRPSSRNFHKVLADFPWYSWKEQLLFPRLLSRCQCDLVHFLHFNIPVLYQGKFIVTIHDLTLFHYPTHKNSTRNWFFYKIKYAAYRYVIRKAISNADKIVTISHSTADDIVKYFGADKKKKIKVIYEAASLLPIEEKFSSIFNKYGIMKPYLLYIGNAYPHKNLEKLAEAFQLLLKKKPDYSLVLVGKDDYFYEKLKKYIKQEKIHSIIILDTVSDKELKALYRGAELFVFPSLYEGFGLPPLEAMQENLPVISSDHKCMREILGESAYYFNGNSANSIFKAMLKVISDEELKNNLVKKGKKQVKKYSWAKMGKKIKLLYSGKDIF